MEVIMKAHLNAGFQSILESSRNFNIFLHFEWSVLDKNCRQFGYRFFIPVLQLNNDGRKYQPAISQ